MKQFVKKYGHAWLLSYAFIYLAWFFHLEETTKPPYNIIHIALDDSIPFVEAFIIPYLLWFPYVAVTVAYFFFTSKNDYYRLCALPVYRNDHQPFSLYPIPQWNQFPAAY